MRFATERVMNVARCSVAHPNRVVEEEEGNELVRDPTRRQEATPSCFASAICRAQICLVHNFEIHLVANRALQWW